MDVLQEYLTLQKTYYEQIAEDWSLENKDAVVGSYDAHNSWTDYDTFLFKDFDTAGLTALEYGCGPGRNIIRYGNVFAQVDGVDIANTNLEKAKINLKHNGITTANLYLCDGKSIPVDDSKYDVVFSVICLQHIACYDARFNIFLDAFRVLKPGGKFSFQMGYGGRVDGGNANYYDNYGDENYMSSGGYDVSVTDEQDLKKDLLEKIGFFDYKSDIRPTGPGDSHRNWIWVQVQK
jgi:ubiquinone/menaquinone biosynthesis C-methylase UbiE